MQIARIPTVLFFLATFTVLCAWGNDEPVSEPTVYVDSHEMEYRFFPGGRIGISIETSGSLKIVGWDRGSVRVEAERRIYSQTEEKARTFLKTPPVRIRYTETTSTIQVADVPELGGLLEVNLIVYVPAARTDLAAQTKKGDFIINAVNGWVEATIGEGNMDITTVNGYFSGRTTKGNILVNLSGNRWNGQSFAAVTQAGNAELLLPENYSAALQLDTRNGEIAVDYPQQKVEGEFVPFEITKRRDAQQLRARVGDGGAPLHIGTQSGNVSLRRR